MLTKPHNVQVAETAGRLVAQVNNTISGVNNALVNGIKANPAMGITEAITPEELAAAIGSENVAKLQAALAALG